MLSVAVSADVDVLNAFKMSLNVSADVQLQEFRINSISKSPFRIVVTRCFTKYNIGARIVNCIAIKCN